MSIEIGRRAPTVEAVVCPAYCRAAEAVSFGAVVKDLEEIHPLSVV